MAYQPYNYNPLYPNGYGTPNYQQYQQPQPTFQQQQVPQTGTIMEVRYAKYEEAVPYLVTEPNKKMLFIITDKPMMIFKATDVMGISTTEYYKTEKVDNLSTETKSPEFDPKEFVRMGDLSEFINEETLNAKFDEFTKTFTKQIDDLSRKIKIKEILSEGEKKDG